MCMEHKKGVKNPKKSKAKKIFRKLLGLLSVIAFLLRFIYGRGNPKIFSEATPEHCLENPA